MKKSKTANNFGTSKFIHKLISKWRNIVGVDPVYVIQFIETTDDNGHPAWIDGLSSDNPHPTANIFINANWLEKNKYDERLITELIVHELLHVVVYSAFIMIDPDYKYEGIKARANEVLTMKLTHAIMKVSTLTK